MKVQIKRISYKALVVSMITIALVFFNAPSVSEAKLKLEEGEFYYTGTQEGEVVFEKGLWEMIVNSLGQIADYLLGMVTLGIRGVAVGWFEVMEILLTAILGVEMDIFEFFKEALAGMDSYTQQIVNVEKIIFNKVEILDANIFKD